MVNLMPISGLSHWVRGRNHTLYERPLHFTHTHSHNHSHIHSHLGAFQHCQSAYWRWEVGGNQRTWKITYMAETCKKKNFTQTVTCIQDPGASRQQHYTCYTTVPSPGLFLINKNILCDFSLSKLHWHFERSVELFFKRWQRRHKM